MKLHVASIVANITDSAWSQSYHAGGVTAIVSIKQKDGGKDESLSVLGKDILNTFESEYFSLETKNLASIKNAVSVTFDKSKDTHEISLIVASVIQSAVYVVLAGKGKVLLIRNGNLATLLEQDTDDVLSASGFLEDNDAMVLETKSFSEKVDPSILLESLTNNSVTEAAEILSPSIHKEKDGSQAALILSYKDEGIKAKLPIIPSSDQKEETAEKKPLENDKKDEEFVVHAPKIRNKSITHRQRIFLTVSVVLLIVFAGTIYFSLQKKHTAQNAAVFSQFYNPAKSKFDEGQGLVSLNPTLAQSDFTQAKQMLMEALNKFPANSPEGQKIQALLDQVNSQLQTTSSTPQQINANKVDDNTDAFLAFAKTQSANYFAQDSSNFYFADSTGINKAPASSGKTTQIIQNSGDWKSIGGFGTYLGNMYVLDTLDGIDKYAVTSSGFGNKSAYFTGSAPDLSKAVSITIDGSIWILGSDGSINKYTRGSKDSFSISGLTRPLNSPSQIFTTVDDNNIYILDNGNVRVVVLKKDGTFVAEYLNQILKQATQIDVNESSKKSFILSGGSIYELDFK